MFIVSWLARTKQPLSSRCAFKPRLQPNNMFQIVTEHEMLYAVLKRFLICLRKIRKIELLFNT